MMTSNAMFKCIHEIWCESLMFHRSYYTYSRAVVDEVTSPELHNSMAGGDSLARPHDENYFNAR
jgi:hypothetical protein